MPFTSIPETLGQGPAGVPGDDGADGTDGQTGGWGLAFTFDTGTGTPPGDKEVRLDNATLASVTHVYVDETERGGSSVAAALALMGVGDNIKLFSEVDGHFSMFTITAASDAGDYYDFTVTYVASSGGFADGEAVTLAWTKKGATGATGAQGAAGSNGSNGAQGEMGGWSLRLQFDDGTTEPPSDRHFRFNHATPSSVTEIWIDDDDADGNNIDAALDMIVSGTNIKIFSRSDGHYHLYTVTAMSDDGAYHSYLVNYVGSYGAIADEELCGLGIAAANVTSVRGVQVTSGEFALYNTTSWTDVTDVSVTFVLDQQRTVTIYATFSLEDSASVQAGCLQSSGYFGFDIDGADHAVGFWKTQDINPADGTTIWRYSSVVTITHLATLMAGSHTVKLRFKTAANAALGIFSDANAPTEIGVIG